MQIIKGPVRRIETATCNRLNTPFSHPLLQSATKSIPESPSLDPVFVLSTLSHCRNMADFVEDIFVERKSCSKPFLV